MARQQLMALAHRYIYVAGNSQASWEDDDRVIAFATKYGVENELGAISELAKTGYGR